MIVKNTGQKKNNKGVYVFKKKSMMSAETKLTTIIEITNNCTFSMNFYSEMFNMKLPNGEGLFNTLEVKLACDECLKGDHPERCVHMTDEIPPWKSVAKFDMIKAIYGNKTDLLQRYVELTLLFLTLISNNYTQRIHGTRNGRYAVGVQSQVHRYSVQFQCLRHYKRTFVCILLL